MSRVLPRLKTKWNGRNTITKKIIRQIFLKKAENNTGIQYWIFNQGRGEWIPSTSPTCIKTILIKITYILE